MISSPPRRDLYAPYADPSVPLRKLFDRVWGAGGSDGSGPDEEAGGLGSSGSPS